MSKSCQKARFDVKNASSRERFTQKEVGAGRFPGSVRLPEFAAPCQKALRAANVLLKKKSERAGFPALRAFLNLPHPIKKRLGPRTFHSKRSRSRPVFRLCDPSLKSRRSSAQRLLYHISGQNTSASPGQNSGQHRAVKKAGLKMFQTTPYAQGRKAEQGEAERSLRLAFKKALSSSACFGPVMLTKDFSYPCKKNRAVFG